METIYADECGYTGSNLLDIDQPVFVWATMKLTEENADELKREFFSGFKGPELKHSILTRRECHRTRVLKFLEHLSERQDQINFAYVHKEFALTAKMVDWIIEPSFHEAGISIYKGGLNIALANLTYTIVRSLGGREFLREILVCFEQLMRSPSVDTLAEYCASLHTQNAPEPLEYVLDMFRLATRHLGVKLIGLLDPSCLEIASTVALVVMGQWARENDGPFRLIQDDSSEMAKNKAIWDTIVHPAVPETMVGWDRRTMQYPLRVQETVLADSKQHSGLQLADVLAGAIARSTRAGASSAVRNDKYAQQIIDVIGEWVCSEHIWPSSDVTPKDLNTSGPAFADPIKHIEELLRRSDQTG